MEDVAKQETRSSKRTGKKGRQPTANPPEDTDKIDRRSFMSRIGNSALVVAAVGGLGWYVVSEVRAGIEEGDLSKVGNGISTIVQIHDPQCPTCQTLQREVRAALDRRRAAISRRQYPTGQRPALCIKIWRPACHPAVVRWRRRTSQHPERPQHRRQPGANLPPPSRSPDGELTPRAPANWLSPHKHHLKRSTAVTSSSGEKTGSEQIPLAQAKAAASSSSG